MLLFIIFKICVEFPLLSFKLEIIFLMTSLAPSDFSVTFLAKFLLILNIFSLISLLSNSFATDICLLSILLNKLFIKFISLSLITSLLIIASKDFASTSFNTTSLPVCFNIFSFKVSLLIT